MGKKWKVYRAIYSQYGVAYVEGSYPKERFEQEAARGYGIKYVLGVRVKRNRHYEIDIIVEGPEEVLKYIFELVKEEEKKSNDE